MKRFCVLMMMVGVLCLNPFAEGRGYRGRQRGGRQNGGGGLSGTVAQVDPANNTFTLQTKKGMITVTVSNTTRYTVDKNPGTAGDVQQGAKVSVVGAMTGADRVRALTVTISTHADKPRKKRKGK